MQRITWRWALLPAAALVFLGAAKAPGAHEVKPPEYKLSQPDREQLLDYAKARAAWDAATKAKDEASRREAYRCAEGHFLDAIHGPGPLPEATLGLAHLYYEQGQFYHADHAFTFLSRYSTGAFKSEALTYQGVIALRRRDWAGAQKAFSEAEAVDLGATRSSVRNKGSERREQELRERVLRLRPVNQAGRELAVYYQAVHPASPAPDQARYEAALAAGERLAAVPPGAFDGQTAALWRFQERIHDRPKELPFPAYPSSRADWSLTIDKPAPSGVTPVTPAEASVAIRTYAVGNLESIRARAGTFAGLPAVQLPPAGEIRVPQDRRHAAQALAFRLLTYEGAGQTGPNRTADFAAAERTLDQLAQYGDVPGVTLMVRQHRIWIALEGRPDLNRARTLIHGEGAADDPLIYEEIASLADKLAAANRTADAQAEWRKVIAGVPESSNPEIRQRQAVGRNYARTLAEWNLGVSAYLAGGNQNNPAHWKAVLDSIAPGGGRETVRFYTALRWAEAVVRSGGPAADLSAALAAADDVVAGRRGNAAQPLGEDLQYFLDYLAIEAHRAGRQQAYASVLAPRTAVYARFEAAAAARAYEQVPPSPADRKHEAQRTLLNRLEAIVRAKPETRSYLQPWIELHRRNQSENEPVFRQIARAELLTAWAETWNRKGADGTRGGNIARSAEAWAEAARGWAEVLAWARERNDALRAAYPEPRSQMVDLSADLGEAARQRVLCLLWQSYRHRLARQRDDAAAALAEAGQAFQEVRPLLPADRAEQLSSLIARMGRSGQETLGRGVGMVRYRPYTGGDLPHRGIRGAVMPLRSKRDRARVSVEHWLNRLQRAADNPDPANPDVRALNLLVDWFNQGYGDLVAQRNRQHAPDRVKQGWDGPSLVAFLRQNVRPRAGWVPKGTIQYGYIPGRGWRMSTVKWPSAGYFLNNGRVIIHAYCSNPMDLILISTSVAVPPPIAAGYKFPVPVPSVVFEHAELAEPVGPWDYPEAFAARAVTPGVGGITNPICPPAITLLLRGGKAPRLPEPGRLPPHCSPSRITIGRISSIDARLYPIRVEKGTAENRKR